MQKSRTYRIALKKEPEGGYTVTVPALPGCITPVFRTFQKHPLRPLILLG
jgi:predicted RNase H-like HicB family nuclease